MKGGALPPIVKTMKLGKNGMLVEMRKDPEHPEDIKDVQVTATFDFTFKYGDESGHEFVRALQRVTSFLGADFTIKTCE